jgi:phosphatidate phosphatase PAH1
MTNKEKEMRLRLSPLEKTWIFDLDGTLVLHNGYLTGEDTVLEGVKELFDTIDYSDSIIILTGRPEEYRVSTEKFLRENRIRFDHLLCGMPTGERILINDVKRSGLRRAYAINCDRDAKIEIKIKIDERM